MLGVPRASAAGLAKLQIPIDAGKNTLRKWMNSVCVPRVKRCRPSENVRLSVASTTRWSRMFACEKRSAPAARYAYGEFPHTR
ncbi:MAG: hypothetical protein DMD49_07980, partial [Gemmatimonadetes bacterium]